jgi:hypothetical protein
MIRYVVAWVPMLFIAIANGALRQFTFGKSMPELRAHQLSTAIGSVAIGLVWLSLTVTFEFAFGRLVMHRPWAQLLNDYHLAGGRVWALFLAWIALAPYIFFRLRHAA